jgi:hypothetical protein
MIEKKENAQDTGCEHVAMEAMCLDSWSERHVFFLIAIFRLIFFIEYTFSKFLCHNSHF